MGLLEMCEKYFGTTNLYEVFGITEKASDKEVKKAYHKLSLRVHPDRVEDDKKLEATEKFKVLGGVHAILSDKEKRSIYDETKCVDDDDNVVQERDWTAYWRVLFKKITLDDIKKYEQEYTDQNDPPKDVQDLDKLEEAKLKAKFPNVPSRGLGGHSAFLQKRLAKGHKFFDSGDYQMAKQKPSNLSAPFKAPAAPAKLPTRDTIPTPETVSSRKSSITQPKFHPANPSFS